MGNILKTILIVIVALMVLPHVISAVFSMLFSLIPLAVIIVLSIAGWKLLKFSLSK